MSGARDFHWGSPAYQKQITFIGEQHHDAPCHYRPIHGSIFKEINQIHACSKDELQLLNAWPGKHNLHLDRQMKSVIRTQSNGNSLFPIRNYDSIRLSIIFQSAELNFCFKPTCGANCCQDRKKNALATTNKDKFML
jgi:hypothetical protein